MSPMGLMTMLLGKRSLQCRKTFSNACVSVGTLCLG